MTNLRNDNQKNFVNFLRENRPVPPHPQSDLEQQLIESIEAQSTQEPRRHYKFIWTIPNAIVTGVLFTSVSLSWKTPRIAIEPNDLEIFLVNNWNYTLNNHPDYTVLDESETGWVLSTVYETQQTLSLSTR